jgi:hypothetical protein
MTVHMHMQRWVARVDWKTSDDLDPDAIDLVMDHLEGHSPVVSRHPVDGIWEATVSIEAPTVEAAVAAAFDLVVGATAETPIGIEVLAEEVFDERAQYVQPLVRSTS